MTRQAPILLAEDEESDVELLRLAMRKTALSTEIIVARDGQEVVDFFTSQAGHAQAAARSLPALLLLDLKMPRMNGFEVLEWVRTQPHLKKLPVIVLSSSSLESDIQKARELGAWEYFVKPPLLSKLSSILQDIHGRYLKESDTPSNPTL
jgi:CheY-like chemotaxis protein